LFGGVIFVAAGVWAYRRRSDEDVSIEASNDVPSEV
jgi:hypothetical protein